MKVCQDCKENKPRTEFHDADSKDGKRGDCKECRNARSRALAATQKDKKRAYQKIYDANNKARYAAYYQSRKEKVAAHNALPEVRARVAARDKGRQRKSKECITRQNHKRRAAPCPVWHYRLVKLTSDTCVNCGTDQDLQIDHVIPIALGGINSFFNFQRLCGDCNRKKGTKLIEYKRIVGTQYAIIEDGVA